MEHHDYSTTIRKLTAKLARQQLAVRETQQEIAAFESLQAPLIAELKKQVK